MRRGLVSAAAALALVGLNASTTLAQQQPEVTVVQIHEAADIPGWWLMDIPSAAAAWYIRLGDGCENAQAGTAGLLVDGTRTEWLVLPDDTPGTCHIEDSFLSDHY